MSLIAAPYGAFFFLSLSRTNTSWSHLRILFNCRIEKRREKKTFVEKRMHRLPSDYLCGVHFSFKSTIFRIFTFTLCSAKIPFHISHSFAHNILLLFVSCVCVCAKTECKHRRRRNDKPKRSPHQFSSIRMRIYRLISKWSLKNFEIMHISIKNIIESESHKANR